MNEQLKIDGIPGVANNRYNKTTYDRKATGVFQNGNASNKNALPESDKSKKNEVV